MKSKVTNRKKGQSLPVLILDAYCQYKQNKYPTDPEIYIIRANTETMSKLLSYSENIIDNKNIKKTDRFMGFKIEIDLRLSSGTIVFGPETIELMWNGD